MGNTNDLESIKLNKQLSRGKGDIPQFFEKIDRSIKSLNENINRKVNNLNVVYKIKKNFIEVKIQTIDIRIVLRIVEYKDIVGVKVEKIQTTHKWDDKIKMYIKNEDELDIAMPLIKRSYNSSL